MKPPYTFTVIALRHLAYNRKITELFGLHTSAPCTQLNPKLFGCLDEVRSNRTFELSSVLIPLNTTDTL